MPRLTGFDGPKGSGKSTFAREMLKSGVEFGPLIDPDALASAGKAKATAATTAALMEARRLREAHLEARNDFAFETVLANPKWLDFFKRARERGYAVTVYWIGIADPSANVARVHRRVRNGGHSIPDHVVVDRRHRSMALLPSLARAVARLVVFDNTNSGPDAAILPVARTRLSAQGAEIALLPDAPLWVETLFHPSR